VGNFLPLNDFAKVGEGQKARLSYFAATQTSSNHRPEFIITHISPLFLLPQVCTRDIFNLRLVVFPPFSLFPSLRLKVMERLTKKSVSHSEQVYFRHISRRSQITAQSSGRCNADTHTKHGPFLLPSLAEKLWTEYSQVFALRRTRKARIVFCICRSPRAKSIYFLEG